MRVSLTVLGSGTSSGVPVIGCECRVCHSTKPKNKRLRSSCLFQVDGKSILVDTSPDLRMQALINQIKRVDAVLFTHIHADHIHGIDELRIYNAYQKASIPVFGDDYTIGHLEEMFAYIFKPKSLYPSLVPSLDGHAVAGLFDCVGIPVQMIRCHHGDKWFTSNYRIGNIAWLTDTNKIPDEEYGLLENLDTLFIDGLRPSKHPTHFHLEASLEAVKKIQPKKAYLIHLAHDYDHDEVNAQLPAGVELAYDGLTVATIPE